MTSPTPVNLCVLLISELVARHLSSFFFPTFCCGRLYDSARRDFNRFFFDGKTLRSLDLSERFRGAESDNEKGSREGRDTRLPSSHCGACMPVGVFHRGREGWGWLVYVEMNCFYGPVNWVGARHSTPAAAFQSVAGAPFRGPNHALARPHTGG